LSLQTNQPSGAGEFETTGRSLCSDDQITCLTSN